VALLVAIVGFASTLAFAQYIGTARGDLQLPDEGEGG
jgi:multisubunit Na+/H+ antiporter MnhF subunit